MKTAKRILPMALFLAGAAAPNTWAQESAALEEIIVTAEKRSVSLQDVPVAVSSYSSDMRDNLGIIKAAEIANITPSTTFNTNPNRIFIRGVGRVENSLGSEPGVALYRDGIYTSEVGSLAESTFFTERVEVLRGPQGTLYGRNAVGGAANFIAKKPTEEFSGELRGGAYSNSGWLWGASVSGPLTDSIRYRLAAEGDKNDGWVENIAGDDVNDKDFVSGEAQLEFDLTDRFNVWMQYEKSEWDANRIGDYMISPYNTETPGPLVLDFFSDFQQLVPNPQFGYDQENPGVRDIHKVNWDDAGLIKSETDRFTAHVSYSFDSLTIKYLYGYTDYEFDYEDDLDKTSRTDLQYSTYLGQDEKSEQHEIQFISDFGGKIEFIAGLFYWENENYQPLQARWEDSPVYATPVIADPAGVVCYCVLDAPANPTSSYYQQWGDLETESTAVYGQVDFYPTEKWHASIGLRYSEDEKTGEEFNRAIFDDQGVYAPFFSLIGMSWFNVMTPTPGPQDRIAWDITFGGQSAEHKGEWDSTDWSLGLDYSFNDDMMLYGKVSTGYKPGGYILGSLEEDPNVDEESVLAYELGLKSEFERTRINVAAYYYDYEDMQLPVSIFESGVTRSKFENAEEATVWGIEVEAQWAPTDSLLLLSTYSYLNSEIESMGELVFDSTAAVPELSDLSGNELINSPENQFSLIADYTWGLSSGDLHFTAVYAYKDDQWSSIYNRPDTQVESFDRTDFRVTYLANEYDLRVSAYVNNAFDEDIIESKTRSSAYYNNQISASIQPPRIYGLEVNYGF